jgi:hypothetical protein
MEDRIKIHTQPIVARAVCPWWLQIAPKTCTANDERYKEYSVHLDGPELNIYVTQYNLSASSLWRYQIWRALRFKKYSIKKNAFYNQEKHQVAYTYTSKPHSIHPTTCLMNDWLEIIRWSCVTPRGYCAPRNVVLTDHSSFCLHYVIPDSSRSLLHQPRIT